MLMFTLQAERKVERTVGGVNCRYIKQEGSDAPHWEPPCADAPSHALITVGNTSPASAQQSQTPADRHDGWAT